MKRNYLLLVVFITVINRCPVNAFAADTSNDQFNGVPAERIVDPMAKKLLRGIVNTATGWGEMPRQLIVTIRRDMIIPGVPAGIVKGVLMTFVRTGTGIVDTITFMSSTPGNYDPLIVPRFVWE